MIPSVVHAAANAFDKSWLSPRHLGQVATRRHLRRVRAVAASDPEWAALEDRRRPDGAMSWSDAKRKREIEVHLAPETPTLTAFLMRLNSARMTQLLLQVDTLFARARHGWAPRDTWSLDVHLCRVLSEMLDHLADNTHSWPDTEDFPRPEDWTMALHHSAAALRVYSSTDNTSDDYTRVLDEAQAALRWVAVNLPSLWD